MPVQRLAPAVREDQKMRGREIEIVFGDFDAE
jgi:hypothetical protein